MWPRIGGLRSLALGTPGERLVLVDDHDALVGIVEVSGGDGGVATGDLGT